MKAKEYLKQIRSITIQIDENTEDLEVLTSLAEKMTSVLSGEVVSRTRETDTMTKTVEDIIKLKNEIECDVLKLIELKREAKYLLSLIKEPSHFKVLHGRYVLFKKWEQIACELNFTYQWVSGDLHGKALQEFQKILDSEKNHVT